MKRKNILPLIFMAALSSAILAQADAGEPDKSSCADTAGTTVENAVDDLPLEEWMSTPFETLGEEDLELENWMLQPFKSVLPKQSRQIDVEEWMLA